MHAFDDESCTTIENWPSDFKILSLGDSLRQSAAIERDPVPKIYT